MGMTPMVATEVFRYIHDYERELKDLVLMYTKNNDVIRSTYASATAIKSKYPTTRIHYSELPFDDIKSENELYIFLEVLGNIVKDEREKYNVNKIYVNISGGRKVQVVAISAFATLIGIDEIWNVLNKEVPDYNYLYEQKKDLIQEFSNGENMDAYSKNKDILDPIFYPSPNILTFIKVPVLKLPSDDIAYLKKLLKGELDLRYEDIPEFKLEAYIQSGLITINKKISVPTKLGEILYKFL